MLSVPYFPQVAQLDNLPFNLPCFTITYLKKEGRGRSYVGASISALQYHLILGHIEPAKDLWQHESEHSRICEHLCVGLFGLIDLFGMQSAHQSGLGKTTSQDNHAISRSLLLHAAGDISVCVMHVQTESAVLAQQKMLTCLLPSPTPNAIRHDIESAIESLHACSPCRNSIPMRRPCWWCNRPIIMRRAAGSLPPTTKAVRTA